MPTFEIRGKTKPPTDEQIRDRLREMVRFLDKSVVNPGPIDFELATHFVRMLRMAFRASVDPKHIVDMFIVMMWHVRGKAEPYGRVDGSGPQIKYGAMQSAYLGWAGVEIVTLRAFAYPCLAFIYEILKSDNVSTTNQEHVRSLASFLNINIVEVAETTTETRSAVSKSYDAYKKGIWSLELVDHIGCVMFDDLLRKPLGRSEYPYQLLAGMYPAEDGSDALRKVWLSDYSQCIRWGFEQGGLLDIAFSQDVFDHGPNERSVDAAEMCRTIARLGNSWTTDPVSGALKALWIETKFASVQRLAHAEYANNGSPTSMNFFGPRALASYLYIKQRLGK